MLSPALPRSLRDLNMRSSSSPVSVPADAVANLYIPGFPKSATTTVTEALARHPAIFSPLTAEPHFWATDMPFYAAREGLATPSAYSALYRRASGDHAWRLDGSTLYLYSETAVSNIVASAPNARFIVCLRPPEEIVLAWHMQMLNGGYETELNPEVAFDLSSARRQGDQVPDGCPDPRLLDYQRIAAIGRQTARLIEVAGAGNVHVVTTAALSRDPRAALQACWEFLELPPSPEFEIEKRNSAFAVRSRRLRGVVYHPRIKPFVTRLLNAIPLPVADALRSSVRKALYRPAQRVPVPEEFQRRLREYFAPERSLLRSSVADVSGAPDPDDPHHGTLLG